MLQQLLHTWDNTSFYLHKQVYYLLATIAAIFVLSFFLPWLFFFSQIVLVLLLISIVADALLLYQGTLISVNRTLPARMNLGDDEKVTVTVINQYPFTVAGYMIDELPYQLQKGIRHVEIHIPKSNSVAINYFLRPTERGLYRFGITNVFVHGPLRLITRRYRCGQNQKVKIYPSYRQLRKYQLFAVANQLQQTGVRRLRKLGHSMEFEQVKEYVRGDDFRTINWKATSRRGELMVNHYTDEKSQQVYCLINKGRVMKMPFEGMTLLDYSMNASLVISGVALQKGDRAGLIAYSNNIDAHVAADRNLTQLLKMMETLYQQQTNFLDPDYEKLFHHVRKRVSQRSLLVMFTNYESIHSLYRDLPFLQKLAHYHLLLVVIFENTELKKIQAKVVRTTEDIYVRTIADQFRHEKLLMARELRKYGIATIVTPPKDLSINLLNKYLELKNRQMI